MNEFPYLNHFTEKEFICKCGCGYADFDHYFLKKLDRARELAGISFILNSACRCRKHNKEVGGVENSSHIFGCAVDIKCDNSFARIKIVYGLITAGFKRIIVHQTFIHADTDPRKQNIFDIDW